MLKAGPVIWLDCADKQPNVGTGGTAQYAYCNGLCFFTIH